MRLRSGLTMVFILVLASCSSDISVDPDVIVGEAVRAFCSEQFDCAAPATLYVISAYIDTDTELGNEVPFEDATRTAIETALDRPFEWLETPDQVDAAVQETPSPTILTVGKPVLYQYVAETAVGWGQGLFEGKFVTMSVDLGNQNNDDPQTPPTTAVP